MGTKVSILGATGYAGAELARLVAAHPAMQVVALGGHSSAGRPAREVLPHLSGVDLPPVLPVAEAAAVHADVCFSCLPIAAPEGTAAHTVIDLSDAHRADAEWVYGLSEFARDDLGGATRVANPGCYPTAVLLVLVPLMRAGLVRPPVVVDALSGVTGAGRRAEERLMYASIDGDAASYGCIPHRHVDEMEVGLSAFAGCDAVVSFTPHLVPMKRGIVVTARASAAEGATDEKVLDALRAAYTGERFVDVSEGWPHVAHVTGSNRALVSARVDDRAGFVVASAAIDNLVKGAAGQALQNANICLGYDESLGLSGGALWP